MKELLMIGGLAMRQDELTPICEGLRDADINAATFDNLYVGDGPRPETHKNSFTVLSIEQQARHQWQVAKKKFGDIPICIFGISMGGMIAAAMAVQRPEKVKRLFLCATSANLPERPAIPNALFDEWTSANTPEKLLKAVDIAFGKTTRSERPDVRDDYFHYRLNGKNGQGSKEFLMHLNSIRSFPGAQVYLELQKKPIPTYLLAGDEDELFFNDHLKDLKKLLPHADVCNFERTGHMVHLENAKDLSKSLIRWVI